MRRRTERVGWVMLVAGSVGAVTVFLLDVALYRLICQSPPYIYGETRTELCAGTAGTALQATANVAILLLVTAGVSGGAACGAVTVAQSRGRGRSMWLVLSTAVYLAALGWFSVVSAKRDLGFGPTAQYAALMSAGILLTWLAASGLIVLIASQIRGHSEPS